LPDRHPQSNRERHSAEAPAAGRGLRHSAALAPAAEYGGPDRRRALHLRHARGALVLSRHAGRDRHRPGGRPLRGARRAARCDAARSAGARSAARAPAAGREPASRARARAPGHGVILCGCSANGDMGARAASLPCCAAMQNAAGEEPRVITDTVPVAAVRCDREWRYIWVSPTYARWVARPPKQILGLRVGDVIGAPAMREIEPIVARVLAGEPVQFERLSELPGLGRHWIKWAYTPTF